MAKSMWVTLQIFLRSGSMYLFHMTDRMWATLKIILEGSLITSFPMTNRLWVTLHILWKAISSHLFLQPKACEWYWKFSERQSHQLSLWPTASEWHCTFSDLHSQHSSIYEYLIFHYTPCISESKHVAILLLPTFDIIIIIDCKILFQLNLFTFLGLQVSEAISWGINYHISLHASV